MHSIAFFIQLDFLELEIYSFTAAAVDMKSIDLFSGGCALGGQYDTFGKILGILWAHIRVPYNSSKINW